MDENIKNMGSNNYIGFKLEPDNRPRFIVCEENIIGNNIESLTIGKVYEHIPDDSLVYSGGVSGLRGSRDMYYTVIDDEGEKHNFYKKLFNSNIKDEFLIYLYNSTRENINSFIEESVNIPNLTINMTIAEYTLKANTIIDNYNRANKDRENTYRSQVKGLILDKDSELKYLVIKYFEDKDKFNIGDYVYNSCGSIILINNIEYRYNSKEPYIEYAGYRYKRYKGSLIRTKNDKLTKLTDVKKII
jgi:hypothetical protein